MQQQHCLFVSTKKRKEGKLHIADNTGHPICGMATNRDLNQMLIPMMPTCMMCIKKWTKLNAATA